MSTSPKASRLANKRKEEKVLLHDPKIQCKILTIHLIDMNVIVRHVVSEMLSGNFDLQVMLSIPAQLTSARISMEINSACYVVTTTYRLLSNSCIPKRNPQKIHFL